MKIHFFAKSSEGTIDFLTDVFINDNEYIFKDLSMSNTNVLVKIKDSRSLILKRMGETNMEMELIEGEKTKGHYVNSMGLEFYFDVNCLKLNIKEKKIYINYDYFMDNELMSSHKIWLLIK